MAEPPPGTSGAGRGASAANDQGRALTRRNARLLLLPAAVVLLHLAGSLAPAEPRLLGVPLGLALQLGVAAASMFALWRISRVLLPERARSGTDPEADPAARAPVSPKESPGGRP